ncbi:MAG TPA: Hpt domain-containing protein [Rhizomicrobium sp.]|nr:Hpt domain-containing protein [Rhizomicrobium sp.]
MGHNQDRLMARDAIDLVHLARYTGGDPALNAEILRLFDGQARELVDRLQSILDARDARSWREVTHTLKGAARGVGAFGLGDAAAAAEPIDPSNDLSTASAALLDLQDKTGAVLSFISSYLAA